MKTVQDPVRLVAALAPVLVAQWLVVLLALPAPARADAGEPVTLVHLAASVLRIEAPRSAGGFAIGSGVAVGRERVVTNCHVTRDAEEIRVVRGGVRWRVSAQASDAGRDLCLLKVPGLQADPVPLGRAEGLAIGQRVAALGFTGGAGLQTSAGEVVELHRHDGAQVIQSSNWFNSGASGGGLFDTEGRLVGILTFRLRGGQAHYFAAPVEWVRQMLDDSAAPPFDPVGPLEARPVAFWQRPVAVQPRFLQAAVLQRDDRWQELAELARDWAAMERDDAEPWHVLGQALERLDRPAEARAALECSLRRAPTHPAIRSRLDALRQRAAVAAEGDFPCPGQTAR